MFMWRAVDKEGEVLDVLVQKRRNKAAALKLLRKLLKKQGFVPEAIVTDGLASYRAALRELGGLARHRPGRLQENNRVEKIRIFPCEGANGRCSGSSPRGRLSGSSPPTVQSTTPSTSSVTSHPERQCGTSDLPLSRSGTPRPPQRLEISGSRFSAPRRSYPDKAVVHGVPRRPRAQIPRNCRTSGQIDLVRRPENVRQKNI